MATLTSENTGQIDELLRRLRRGIRGYVWCQGLLAAVIWVVSMFWLAFALDYLPVLVGASEMPVAARAVLLALVALGLAVVLYRWILRRLAVPIRDGSLALLIERRHPAFREALVTSVELDRTEGSFGSRMLERTRDWAARHLDSVRLTRVFNYGPLAWLMAAVVALLMSWVGFGWVAGDQFRLALSRLYGLSREPYPRRTLLEVLEFQEGRRVVARGSDVTIRVRAAADRPTPPPRVCTISYQLADGSHGRVNMNKQGLPQDGFQNYSFDGIPFQGVLSDIRFDVRGNDCRIRDNRLRVVDSPVVADARLLVTLPSYTGLVSRNEPYRPGVPVPMGSRVTVRLESNKPLERATLRTGEGARPAGETSSSSRDAGSGPIDAGEIELRPLASAPRQLEFELGTIEADIDKDIVLHDQDGIVSSRPYRLHLVAMPDKPPQVDVRLRGIGSAITADARLPLRGTISDDFGVSQVTMGLEVPGQGLIEFPAKALQSGSFNDALDLREHRQDKDRPLKLSLGSHLQLTTLARDRYDLGKEPNLGQGDRYELEVVTVDRLLSILETRELGLRQRFEQMVSEMRQMRDSLARAVITGPADGESTNGEDPPGEMDAGAEPEDVLARESDLDAGSRLPSDNLNLLRVQRAGQHVERAVQEVLGVALALDDIRHELINNRVESSERQLRLKNELARPLRQIANVQLPQLAEDLTRWSTDFHAHALEESLGDNCLRQADDVILAMEQVLAKMLDLESYNELLDLVRSLIRQQEDLEQKTREEQRRKVMDLLK